MEFFCSFSIRPRFLLQVPKRSVKKYQNKVRKNPGIEQFRPGPTRPAHKKESKKYLKKKSFVNNFFCVHQDTFELSCFVASSAEKLLIKSSRAHSPPPEPLWTDGKQINLSLFISRPRRFFYVFFSCAVCSSVEIRRRWLSKNFHSPEWWFFTTTKVAEKSTKNVRDVNHINECGDIYFFILSKAQKLCRMSSWWSEIKSCLLTIETRTPSSI